MPGVKMLRKIQLGREVTAGTAVVATTTWRGEGQGEDNMSVIFPSETVGVIGGVNRSYIAALGGSVQMSGNATFEQLLHVLEAGVKTVVPAADGAGSGKVSTYTFPTTALNTQKTYTIEAGDNQQAEKMEYCFVDSFDLSGKAGEGLTLTANWLGRQWVTATYTSLVILPVVEDIIFSKAKLYIDAIGGTIGTTQVSNSLLSMALNVKTGIIPVRTADGNKYFSFTKGTSPTVGLQVVFEHETSAVAEKANWRAGTPRLIRLDISGSTLTTAGTFTTKTLRIDLAGTWEKFGALADQDGNDTIAGTFRALYDTTAAKFAEITVVHQLTAVP